MPAPLKLGSDAWREHVFSTAPIAIRSEKARPSVRYAPTIDGESHRFEGANNQLAAYALTYCKRLGAVLRWKTMPFEWLLPSGVKPTVPKFLLELSVDRKLVVIQTYSNKYLTAKVQAKFDEERSVSEKAGMAHVVWTDQKPLTPALRNLHFHIRRARKTEADAAAVETLVEFVQVTGRRTIDEIVEAGHDPSLVPIALYETRLFVPLDRKLQGETLVTSAPQDDARAFLLLSGSQPSSWWDSLRVK
jgi:hypothetical protein